MKRKSSKPKRRGKSSATMVLAGPPSATTSYRGPIHQNPPRGMLERSVQVLNYDSTVTATAGGSYALAIGTGSSSGTVTLQANALEWTSFSGQFSDYRVLGLRVEFVPQLEGAQYASTVSGGPFYTVTDMDDATAPTVYGDLASFNTLRFCANNKAWFREVSMMGRPGEGDIIPITTAFTRFQSIKVICTGITANAVLGRIHVWWRVQFFHRE